MIFRCLERAGATRVGTHERDLLCRTHGWRSVGLRGYNRVMNQRWQFIQLTRSAQHIHLRKSLENIRPVALGHASYHTNHQLRLGCLALAQLAQARPDLLLGVLTHRAGVVKDHVGLIAILNALVSPRAKLPQNQLAVEHVHLAAESFQIQFAFHTGSFQLSAFSYQPERRPSLADSYLCYLSKSYTSIEYPTCLITGYLSSQV